jgi:beta-aspartyl-peptidase (threonine type)
MKKTIIGSLAGLFLAGLFLLFFVHAAPAQSAKTAAEAPAGAGWVIVIHGGAGGPPKGSMAPEKEAAYIAELNAALKIGSEILSHGGSSLDAVEAAVKYMEDCPLFNAGKGAVLNEEGVAELDAAIMDGQSLKAGAVTGVTTVKNPILAARAVMDRTKHVFLAGDGAEQFAGKCGLEIVDPSYFITPERKAAWEKSHQPAPAPGKTDPTKPGGTVGAVALDSRGNLAAATSTGGMMNKMKGRIGDTPVIGAGTYANNATCAVSATGHGEFFIRNVVAYDLSAMMEYRRMALQEAADLIVNKKLKAQEASGGLIAVDHAGNIAMPFNSNAMFRGYMKASGESAVAVY